MGAVWPLKSTHKEQFRLESYIGKNPSHLTGFSIEREHEQKEGEVTSRLLVFTEY